MRYSAHLDGLSVLQNLVDQNLHYHLDQWLILAFERITSLRNFLY
jgi:hypothetical protein